jgi:tRNA (Thr-GGU) A37 N-methylase
MDGADRYVVRPIGVVRSPLRAVADAPNQAFEGAPEALLEIDSALADALHRLEPGDELIVLIGCTWLSGTSCRRTRRETNGSRSPACSGRAPPPGQTRSGCTG